MCNLSGHFECNHCRRQCSSIGTGKSCRTRYSICAGQNRKACILVEWIETSGKPICHDFTVESSQTSTDSKAGNYQSRWHWNRCCERNNQHVHHESHKSMKEYRRMAGLPMIDDLIVIHKIFHCTPSIITEQIMNDLFCAHPRR